MARIEATVSASVLVGQDGRPVQVSAEASPRRMPIFEGPVSETLAKGKFRPECAGKSVKLILHYSLEDASGTPRQSVSFGYPNEFWITAEAMTVQP